MEKHLFRPRLIILLLSVVLIAGAVVAAFTIDGGRWLTASPVFAQPASESLQQDGLVPVTAPVQDVQTVQDQSSQPEYGCHHDSAMNPADW